MKTDLLFEPLSSLSEVFEELGSVQVLFFSAGGVLYLRAGKKGIELTNDIHSRHTLQDGHRRLTLHRGQEALPDPPTRRAISGSTSRRTWIPSGKKRTGTLGPSSTNVLSSPERRTRMWREDPP